MTDILLVIILILQVNILLLVATISAALSTPTLPD